MSGDSQISILQDVNLTVQKGESIAILGASGSGKTTLLTLLAGLDFPSSGDIYFQQHHLNKLNEDELAAIRLQQVGFIFQSFNLLPSLTALENVMLPLEIQSVSNDIAEKEALHWLHEVGLSQRVHHFPTKLSGGEQQRVAIARAFVNNPSLILADEMTGNLDEHTGELVSNLLFSLNEKNQTTLVLVTHDKYLGERCHKQVELRDGVLHT